MGKYYRPVLLWKSIKWRLKFAQRCRYTAGCGEACGWSSSSRWTNGDLSAKDLMIWWVLWLKKIKRFSISTLGSSTGTNGSWATWPECAALSSGKIQALYPRPGHRFVGNLFSFLIKTMNKITSTIFCRLYLLKTGLWWSALAVIFSASLVQMLPMMMGVKSSSTASLNSQPFQGGINFCLP